MFGRGGPFGSMFGNDPFFSDPFSHMDRMMSSMLNGPFFANPAGLGLGPPGVQLLQPTQNLRGRQPVIEEVDDTGHAGRTATAQDEPIVEEPDDEPSPQDRASQRQRRHSPPRQQVAQPHMMPLDPFSQLFGALAGGGGGAGGGSSFMISSSSSSYSSMGPGGMSYQASSTTRVGPGGVRETQAVVRDGRSGTESVTISRGLGDGRQRTLVRTRDGITGREEQLEDLRGMQEHDAEGFDEQWRQHAERSLPGGGGFGAVSGRVAGGGGGGRSSNGTAQQRPLALPPAAAAGAAGHGSNTAGLYDTTGLSAAQRATYVRQPSAAAGTVRLPSGGGGGSTNYSGSTGAGGGGAYYYPGNGARSSAPRDQSYTPDGQYWTGPQPTSGGAGRASAGSGGRYTTGSGRGHARHGY